MIDPEIRNNADARRYELDVEGLSATVAYNLTGPHLMITETLVPTALEGRGIASRLARHVVEDARKRGLVILPVCTFFGHFFQKHPEQADVVHPDYRKALGLA
jgi:predicted GNAT family acetyltransferase